MSYDSSETSSPGGPGGSNALGLMLGRYTLLAELGHGGMADVFVAVSSGPSGFSKLCVLKHLRKNLAKDPEFLAMFLDEARLAARLNHPNVVQTYEVLEENNNHVLVMEYLEGEPLSMVLRRARMSKDQPFPLAHQIKIACDTLQGLQHAHELADFQGNLLNLVHRDISPHNIFVTFDGSVKVLDFGIAKAADSSTETKTGILKGKIHYMAPEQMVGGPLDLRADIYSVGVMLWEVATGERIWKNHTSVQIMHRVAKGDVPLPSSIIQTNAELERICMKAMSLQPSDRYPSCEAMQEDLEKLLTKLGGAPSQKEIGRYVADLFVKERSEMKRVLDARLSEVRKLSSSQIMTAMAVLPSLATSGETNSFFPGSGNSASSGSHSRNEVMQVSTPPGPNDTTPAKRNKVLIFVPIGLLAVGAIVFAVTTQNSGSSPSVNSKDNTKPTGQTARETTRETEPKPAGSAPIPPNTAVSLVKVRITASPTSAKIWFDGTELVGNPATANVAPGTTTHDVRAEAAGFATKSRTITAEHDTDVEMPLERAGTTTPSSTPPPPTYVGTRPPKPTERPAIGTTVVTPPVGPVTAPTTPPDKPATKPTASARPLDKDIKWD